MTLSQYFGFTKTPLGIKSGYRINISKFLALKLHSMYFPILEKIIPYSEEEEKYYFKSFFDLAFKKENHSVSLILGTSSQEDWNYFVILNELFNGGEYSDPFVARSTSRGLKPFIGLTWSLYLGKNWRLLSETYYQNDKINGDFFLTAAAIRYTGKKLAADLGAQGFIFDHSYLYPMMNFHWLINRHA
ncbi:MAG: hypothetical protein ABIO44_07910, partial [Saprospiraceae bacterium]